MSMFTNSLKTEWLDGKKWRVTESYRFYSGDYLSGLYVEVPEGFITDLASIPRLLHWLVPKVGKDSAASVMHDVIYRTGVMTSSVIVDGVEHVVDTPVSQGMADSMFHQAMVALKVGRWRRKILYHGVSIFGWIAWNRYREELNAERTETTK